MERRAAFFMVFLLALAMPAAAQPNLQAVSTISGVKIFRDHQKNHVFYYLRAEKRLDEINGVPDFRYDVNRYIGNEQTGDTDAFWVRGVIKFRVSSEFEGTSYEEIRQQLGATHGVNADLQAAPVNSSYNVLVYETIEPVEDRPNRGEIDGGVVTDSDGEEKAVSRRLGSRKQRFTIGLQALDANFFWENFERDNLILSLSYGWEVEGVIPNDDGGWTEHTYAVSNAMPINVSPRQFPGQFTRNELWQDKQVAHSSVTIMCYDFINLEESDLYYVMVDLRFETLGNRTYQETLKFVADSHEYENKVDFELANDLDKGYEYRIRRLYEDGSRDDSGWLASTESFLDVSMTLDEVKARQRPEGEEI